jgi:hypothetical protein
MYRNWFVTARSANELTLVVIFSLTGLGLSLWLLANGVHLGASGLLDGLP